MNLFAVFSPDRRFLTIIADEKARAELRELGDEIGTDKHLWDAFERLIANSELDWINPVDSGDLTDAPILGILGETTTDPTHPRVQVGRWGDPPHNRYQPVIERWGYMDYQVQSVLAALRDTGRAVFTAP